MAEQQAEQPQVDFVIQKVYLKDMSFEAPNSPAVFQGEWSPEANIEINTNATKLSDNNHEVDLTLTVTAKSKEDNAFLVEIKQTGIFTINGVDDQNQLGHLLGAYCPSVLFPYAREAISSLVLRGGFPELTLAPINFDMLYMQSLQQQADQAINQIEPSA